MYRGRPSRASVLRGLGRSVLKADLVVGDRVVAIHWPHFMLLTPVYVVRLGRHLSRDAGMQCPHPPLGAPPQPRHRVTRHARQTPCPGRAPRSRGAHAPAVPAHGTDEWRQRHDGSLGSGGPGAARLLASRRLLIHGRTGYILYSGGETERHTLGRGGLMNPNGVSSRAEAQSPGRRGATICHRETMVGGEARQET